MVSDVNFNGSRVDLSPARGTVPDSFKASSQETSTSDPRVLISTRFRTLQLAPKHPCLSLYPKMLEVTTRHFEPPRPL